MSRVLAGERSQEFYLCRTSNALALRTGAVISSELLTTKARPLFVNFSKVESPMARTVGLLFFYLVEMRRIELLSKNAVA